MPWPPARQVAEIAALSMGRRGAIVSAGTARQESDAEERQEAGRQRST